MSDAAWLIVPRFIMWSFIAVIFVWDVVANVGGHHDATVSMFLLSNSQKYPIIAFLFGLLAGHAFWPNE